MEKTFQIDNVDINAIHDKLVNELQNRGLEIHRDEPRDNGFKVFVRRDYAHGEVEVFNDWGTVRLITHGELEWDLMNIAEPLINQPPSMPESPPQLNEAQGQTAEVRPMPEAAPQPPVMRPPSPSPPMTPQPQFPHPVQSAPQPTAPQPAMPQPATPQPPMYHPTPQPPQGGLPEHTQLVNVLTQSGYQIEVNTTNGQIFFVRGRKGNYVIDIEGRPQP
ncbi:hypothetical protein [Stygiolobus caldivivus]|uniref:Uncharacterized protein n=1 Tax=Stygiolobus caldivivus TaxID=2824673 RepID=A0A8D5ZEN2_9CREN|nr:hypothetical protein [Stygiolobus caldivivus]BCU69778.1 hypothetical protein KN1_10750 [Stygiolobus caldivivus]